MSGRRRTDAGFTLIEMIVVLVVLGMAMAAIFPAIGNMLRSGARASSMSQAASEADIAASLLLSDVKKAVGSRGTGERTDTASVGATAATIPSLSMDGGPGGNPALADIREAGPTRLILNADVLPTVAGIEQVDWQLLSGANNPLCGDFSRYNGRNWCIRRTVSTAGGNRIMAETLTKGRGDYPTNLTTCADPAQLPAITTRLFCFQEAVPRATNGAPAGSPNAYNNVWSPSCLQQWFSDASGPNRTQLNTNSGRINTVHNKVDPASSIARIDRIVTVNASIYGGGGYGRASELSYEHVSASVRSRQGEAYHEAIMCGTKARWGQ
jgi:prepilin-type N-terminal cleavage/methylation domain-containing protein